MSIYFFVLSGLEVLTIFFCLKFIGGIHETRKKKKQKHLGRSAWPSGLHSGLRPAVPARSPRGFSLLYIGFGVTTIWLHSFTFTSNEKSWNLHEWPKNRMKPRHVQNALNLLWVCLGNVLPLFWPWKACFWIYVELEGLMTPLIEF